MKGVILGIAPEARIVDLTHEVPPQDVLAGALALEAAAPYFPPGTIHVAVVDPGVGTRRRALLVTTRTAVFVGPDNGLLSLAVPAGAVTRTLDVSRSRARRKPVSATFHGRDVFAPVAAEVARGTAPARLGVATRPMRRLALPRVRRAGRRLTGTVLAVDRFGNLITNIRRADLGAAAFRRRSLSIRIGGHVVPIRHSYGSGRAGEPTALVNSGDLLEVAVRDGSAAVMLGLGRGAPVAVEAI
jgi:S-adenosylmethionine hydrolase